MTPEQIKAEFKEHYDIDPEQIFFDEQGRPFFDSESLSLLSIKLAPQIRNIETDASGVEFNDTFVFVPCSIYLETGACRSSFGTAFIAENSSSETIETAINLAKARALRSGLRAVGFDPVKAHEARKSGNVISLQPPTAEDEGTRLRKAIHAIRDEMNVDTETYRRYLVIATKKSTTKEMGIEDLQRGYLFLTGLNEGRKSRMAA